MNSTTRAILGALASYRLTKLVIDDEITRELREKAFDALDAHPNSRLGQKITYLLSCPWCVSIYAGTSLAVLHALSPKLYDIVVQSLGYSAATGLLFTHID